MIASAPPTRHRTARGTAGKSRPAAPTGPDTAAPRPVRPPFPPFLFPRVSFPFAAPVSAEPRPAAPPRPSVRLSEEPGSVWVAGLAGALAVGLLAWGGWGLWTENVVGPTDAAPARLGVQFAPVPVPPDEPAAGGASNPLAARPGLLVTDLSDVGPARRCGVRVGDVWLTFAGQPLCESADDPADAARRVRLLGSLLRTGFEAEATLERNGAAIAVTLREDALELPEPQRSRPWPLDLPPERGLIGLELLTGGPFYPDAPPGVLIVTVVPGGPADRAGLRVGDRLVALTRLDVEARAIAVRTPTPEGTAYFAFARELKPGDRVELELLRRGRPVAATVTFAAGEDLPRFPRRGSLTL